MNQIGKNSAAASDAFMAAIPEFQELTGKAIREQVTGINFTARTVAELAQETMDTTGKLAVASVQQTALSIGRLGDPVHKLSDSVADFKLPKRAGDDHDA